MGIAMKNSSPPRQASNEGRIPTHVYIHLQQDLTIDRQSFRQMLENTYFFMAQLDGCDCLFGLLLETDGALLRAVATDGRRLVFSAIRMSSPVRRNERVIVPHKAVLVLRRLLDDEEDLSMSLGTNNVRIRSGGRRYAFGSIDARFPDYNRAVPTSVRSVETADHMHLRQLLRSAARLCSVTSRGVRLDLGKNRLEVRADDPVLDPAGEALEAKYRGMPMAARFNVDYLLDALAAVDGQLVQLIFGDSNSGCLIRVMADANTSHLVMPLRLGATPETGDSGHRKNRRAHGPGETECDTSA